MHTSKNQEFASLQEYSNPYIAQKRAREYLGPGTVLKRSTRKNKKYMVLNPYTNEFVHFGQIPYEDYTKHRDKNRQRLYLLRTAKRARIENSKYTANNLARNILWL